MIAEKEACFCSFMCGGYQIIHDHIYKGAGIVGIIIQGKKEADDCYKGYGIPLVADIHFVPSIKMPIGRSHGVESDEPLNPKEVDVQKLGVVESHELIERNFKSGFECGGKMLVGETTLPILWNSSENFAVSLLNVVGLPPTKEDSPQNSYIEPSRMTLLLGLQMVNTIEYRVDCQLLQQLHSDNEIEVSSLTDIQYENPKVFDKQRILSREGLHNQGVMRLARIRKLHVIVASQLSGASRNGFNRHSYKKRKGGISFSLRQEEREVILKRVKQVTRHFRGPDCPQSPLAG
eukprot:Gb_24875 [translate_table: standard]